MQSTLHAEIICNNRDYVIDKSDKITIMHIMAQGLMLLR